MRLGNVQGSPINHILYQGKLRLEKFFSLCGIRNEGTVTLTRTNVDRPICSTCAAIGMVRHDTLPEVGEGFDHV
jgi:hypothetical protein